MGIFTYIGNVVTGRFAHWNDANNQRINEMWERSQHFPEDIKIPFQDFISSCSLLMNYLLGPDQGCKRLIKKDPLRITRQQFRSIHAIILEAFVGMFLKLNPSFSDSFKPSLAILTGKNPDESRILRFTEQMGNPDISEIGCAAWEEIIAAAESPQGSGALDAYPFSMLFGAVALESFKDVRGKLKVTSAQGECGARPRSNVET
jgi:hypothetical protein